MFDVERKTRTTHAMSKARMYPSVVALGDVVYIAFGDSNVPQISAVPGREGIVRVCLSVFFNILFRLFVCVSCDFLKPFCFVESHHDTPKHQYTVFMFPICVLHMRVCGTAQ